MERNEVIYKTNSRGGRALGMLIVVALFTVAYLPFVKLENNILFLAILIITFLVIVKFLPSQMQYLIFKDRIVASLLGMKQTYPFNKLKAIRPTTNKEAFRRGAVSMRAGIGNPVLLELESTRSCWVISPVNREEFIKQAQAALNEWKAANKPK